ncbi:MAG: Crp/Fnr family transcriptional regulator [Gammaproteobacteria bacterium]
MNATARKTSETGLLAEHYLFSSFTVQQQQKIGASSRLLNIKSGETLFHQGDKAKFFYLVISGQIKLCLNSRDGNQKIVEVVYPGQTFAEAVAFMTGHRYPVSAQAIEDASLVVIPSLLYLEQLADSNASCFRLLGDISRRLHAVNFDRNMVAIDAANIESTQAESIGVVANADTWLVSHQVLDVLGQLMLHLLVTDNADRADDIAERTRRLIGDDRKRFELMWLILGGIAGGARFRVGLRDSARRKQQGDKCCSEGQFAHVLLLKTRNTS